MNFLDRIRMSTKRISECVYSSMSLFGEGAVGGG